MLHSRVLKVCSFTFFISLLVFLLVYHQPFYPETWLDEGFTLQGAINLVQHGQYAMQSVEGFRILDQPLIANGPGIVLPITMVFSVFGIGLLQARILMVIFSILTILLMLWIVNEVYGYLAALIAIFFILALTDDGFLVLGRTAIGTVPALFYFLTGILLWIRSIKKHSPVISIAAGVFFGFAMITKGQYYLLMPVMVGTGLLNFTTLKRDGLRSFLGLFISMITVLGFWIITQYFIVGPNNIGAHLASISSSSQVTVSALHLSQIPDNVGYLIHSGILVIIGPGLIYYILVNRKHETAGIPMSFLALFSISWLLWFTFVSIGWHRYTFEAYVIGSIFSGKFVVDMINLIRNERKSLSSKLQKYYKIWALGLLIAGMLVITVLGLTRNVSNIVQTPDQSPQNFALYLKNNIPPGVTIESWDWELDDLVGLSFHHPANVWVDEYTALLQFKDPLKASYNFYSFKPGYLINGPFSKWTGIYSNQIQNQCCSLMVSIGAYDLYKIK